MEQGFLIDTNVLIEYTGKVLPEKALDFVTKAIDEEFNIFVINKIEILGHNTSGKEIEEFIDIAIGKHIQKTFLIRLWSTSNLQLPTLNLEPPLSIVHCSLLIVSYLYRNSLKNHEFIFRSEKISFQRTPFYLQGSFVRGTEGQ